MSEIYALNIHEAVEDKVYCDLFHVLSETRKEKTKKYKFEIDAKRSICAEVLIRFILCRKFQTSYSNVEILFQYNPYGKPYIDDMAGQYFNISHGGNWVVCAWSDKEIGVDVDRIKDIDLGVAEHYFSKSEYEELIQKDGDDRQRRFMDYWTLKESYVKYKGRGLSIPLDSISFHFENGKVYYNSESETDIYFHMLDIDKEHKLALCSMDPGLESIRFISIGEIWETLCQ
ncbi:4'-phosphopantetheinyl transferase family protein [Ornithinibacillus scapharcae]|uniref:4'-phosphopantetheinyl transferase family protein n=1 Tax=Ornithinibacillus scapharcae TaxID=1147159 RepID=UPI000225BC06|nr:4'-phosphopantetheinyl transferase superfamily protein [Ornithinibacillus scapharcae]